MNVSKVDYFHQALVAAAIGGRGNVTEQIDVAKISTNQGILTPHVRIGVNDRGCTEPDGAALHLCVVRNYPPFVHSIRRRRDQWFVD